MLEAKFQQYKGRVNFLWVYGSEAHPEEDPFIDGYETTDLGWDHPYSITQTMAERAARAAWMKTDPEPDDFEIPMMVDYINHPGHTDNAIRTAYRGSGFYSAYVIDCDGTVKKAHTWGWYAPGGEWWDLPLTEISDLEAWLEAYLADPPPCYRQDPDADAGVGAGPDSGATADDGPGGGCSASAAASHAWGSLLLLAFIAVFRRRRTG